MIEYDRVVSVDVESGGKIVGIAMAIGEYPEEGDLEDSGGHHVVYILEKNFPESACKDFHYFMTNYWYDLTNKAFVKVESAQPNQYAVYSPTTKTWSWDAALVLDDIRRLRNGRLGGSDWTQLSDTNLTAEQKAAAVEYRKALRDLPTHKNWPNLKSSDWPTKPS